MITIGITGTNGAGKGTIVERLVKNHNFIHYSVRDFIVSELQKQKKEINRDEMRKMGNFLREKFGGDYIVKSIFENAKKINKNAVIESIRSIKELEFLKKQENFFLISVDALQKIRYERIKKRASEKDKIDLKTFQKHDDKERKSLNKNEQNLEKLINESDYKILNNSTITKLNKNIDLIMEKIKIKTKYIRPSWNDYFFEIMNVVGRRSTCDRGRTSCIIVKDKQILVTGYAGAPTGLPHCDDIGHQLKTTIHEDGSKSEHCVRTVHAEQNAICQAAKLGVSIKDSDIYVKMTPCRTCAMLLINCGVKNIYCEKKYHAGKESEDMLKKAKIKIYFKIKNIEKY